MTNESSIYNFLINNDKFENLEAHLNRFNPFKILKISEYEIRHSNVIAWLLNPSGNHNLGYTILKKVILDILMDPENEQSIPESISIRNVYNLNFSDFKVFREREQIDIFVLSESNQFVIYFENKIKNRQKKKQLSGYYDSVLKEFPSKNYKVLPVLLTLKGEEPLHNKYCKYNYSSLYQILTKTIDLYKNRIQNEVLQFIQYYILNLKDILMLDEKIKKLCKDIYNNHKDAVDMIYNVGRDIDITMSFETFKKEYGDVNEISIKNAECTFNIPEFQLSKYSKIDNFKKSNPIIYWFDVYHEKKLRLVLEIQPFDDQTLRDEFIQHLLKFDVNLSNQAKESGRRYARICSETIIIKEWDRDNEEEVDDAMLELYRRPRMEKQRNRLIEGIKTFPWE